MPLASTLLVALIPASNVSAEPPAALAGNIFLNEAMADNVTTIADGFGQFDDYIEVYNSSAAPISLDGYGLTDNILVPYKWPLPGAAIVPAGGYLLLWADGDLPQGPLHGPFALNSGGETLTLTDDIGFVVDILSFTDQAPDVSWGRRTDGAPQKGYLVPTPEGPNPDNAPPIVWDTDASVGFPSPGQNIEVTAEVQEDDGDSVTVTLYYDDGVGFTPVPMVLDSDLYTCSVPAHPYGETISYYVEAVDEHGAGTLRPPDAPGTTRNHQVFVGITAVRINEFMADNATTIQDEELKFEDWIELVNLADFDVDLSGFYLTDDAADTKKWRFPDGTVIDSSGYLLVWADSDDGDPGLHTNFKLSASGEHIGLHAPGYMANIALDETDFGPQATDISEGRDVDGAGTIVTLASPTPIAHNGGGGWVAVGVPDDPPVTVAPGGNFDCYGAVLNRNTTAQARNAWTAALLPLGGEVSPVLGPLSVTLGGLGVAGTGLHQSVPPGAAAGSYTYEVRAGNFPTEEAAGGFPVEVE
ncbi:MAG: hypothetical protein CME06_09195 [Gemmatimonadetes bacterium]|nr:hypothetical protein [Gemmatimonadota bacterium]